MNLLQTARKIKELKIQGASNIAKAAIDAFYYAAKKSKAGSRSKFFNELEKAKKILFNTRPTEPLMRNGIKYILYKLKESSGDVDELKKLISKFRNEFKKYAESSWKKIFEIGANKISNGDVIFTHCHSSTVVNIIKEAKKQGKKVKVINTETRPLYQGRITAKELSKAGIKVIHIVDSAMHEFIREADIAIVGCDLISPEGIVNKIGTSALAIFCRETETPFYVAGATWKFDSQALLGKIEIEQRNPKEVWKNPPKKVEIKNPAFDFVPRNNITSLITEEGILPISNLIQIMLEKYPWILKWHS